MYVSPVVTGTLIYRPYFLMVRHEFYKTWLTYCIILYDWILFLVLKQENKQCYHDGTLDYFEN